jgi:hypothetical protein
MAETNFLIPDNSNGNIPVGALPYLNGGNNGLFGGNGWGGGILGFFLGLLCGNGGFGNFGFGGGNNGNTVDLLMQAINNNGNRNNDAVQQLANSLGQDFTLVNGAINTLQQALFQVSSAQGLNYAQTVNAIQSGNAALASQLQQCCCNMQHNICELGHNLTNTMNNNYIALDNKLDAMESSRKDREIASLTAKVAQLESQNFTTGVVQQAVAPVLGQIAALQNDVAAIKRCQPATITLPNNSMTAVPTIWANGVADYVVDKIASSLNGGTATTPTTPANA